MRSLLIGGMAALMAASVALAADPPPHDPDPSAFGTSLPAVSEINGKLDLFGGFAAESRFGGVIGSISLPLSYPVGFQIDGLAGVIDGDLAAGLAGHLFWRDPATALIGLYADLQYYGSTEHTVGRVGLEAELYFDRVTLEGLAGMQDGNLLDASAFGKLNVSYYPTDNSRIYLGAAYLEDRLGGYGSVGAEVMAGSLGRNGVAVYAEGQIGENSHYSARVGLRLYGGAEKSLIQRHRQDDPQTHFELTSPRMRGADQPNMCLWDCQANLDQSVNMCYQRYDPAQCGGNVDCEIDRLNARTSCLQQADSNYNTCTAGCSQ